MWDERYQGEDFVYGTEPNDFLRSQIDHLPPGRILCPAEGEGRKAVFLAERLTESRPGRPASIYAASP